MIACLGGITVHVQECCNSGSDTASSSSKSEVIFWNSKHFQNKFWNKTQSIDTVNWHSQLCFVSNFETKHSAIDTVIAFLENSV